MTKRFFDFTAALLLLLICTPIIIFACIAIFIEDKGWPLYSPPRVGRNGIMFRMHKLRSMVLNADASKMDTTSKHDPRITKCGRRFRRFKLDELPQLWNVLIGEMSLVGPRPQIERETVLYTDMEQRLLTALPGITDFSSIVFSDLDQIVAPYADANIAYNQLVRPWKSRLGLFYIDHQSLLLDIQLLWLTLMAVISRPRALRGITRLLEALGAPPELVAVCRRDVPLVPTPPLGSDKVVTSREVV